MTKLSILVIDDTPVHQESARQTLAGHDVTVASSYEEGFKLLVPLCEGYVATGQKGAQFDVVLSDLLMPAPGTMLCDEARQEHQGKEQPLGWALVLRAVLNGTPFAAVVSQTNHHDHPAAFALDAIDNADDSWEEDERHFPTKHPQFAINGATVGFFQAPLCDVEGYPEPGKDWGKVLRVIGAV